MMKYNAFIDYSESFSGIIADPVSTPAFIIMVASVASAVFCITGMAKICQDFEKFPKKHAKLSAISQCIWLPTVIATIVLNTTFKGFMRDQYNILSGVNVTTAITYEIADCYYLANCVCTTLGNTPPCANATYGTTYCAFNQICCAQYQTVCYPNYPRDQICSNICILALQTQNCQYTYTQCNVTTVINVVYSDIGNVIAKYNLTIQHLVNSSFVPPKNTTTKITYAPWDINVAAFPPKRSRSGAIIVFIMTFGWPAFAAAAVAYIRTIKEDIQETEC